MVKAAPHRTHGCPSEARPVVAAALTVRSTAEATLRRGDLRRGAGLTAPARAPLAQAQKARDVTDSIGRGKSGRKVHLDPGPRHAVAAGPRGSDRATPGSPRWTVAGLATVLKDHRPNSRPCGGSSPPTDTAPDPPPADACPRAQRWPTEQTARPRSAPPARPKPDRRLTTLAPQHNAAPAQRHAIPPHEAAYDSTLLLYQSCTGSTLDPRSSNEVT